MKTHFFILYIYICVCVCVCVCVCNGEPTISCMGGGRTNQEAKWLQPLASVASVSHEIRGVRFTCIAPSWPPLHIYIYILSRSCWCAQAGHQCLCVLSTWLVVCLVPCAPMSIVCPLPSCYLIIVSVAPAVSPSLPSFVSLYSLLVSAVLC